MTDVDSIVAGLSEAQRELLLHPSYGQGGFLERAVSNEPVVMPPIRCIDYFASGPGYEKARLTPLGLAVRAKLEADNAD